jgi:hypothetical protein
MIPMNKQFRTLDYVCQLVKSGASVKLDIATYNFEYIRKVAESLSDKSTLTIIFSKETMVDGNYLLDIVKLAPGRIILEL